MRIDSLRFEKLSLESSGGHPFSNVDFDFPMGQLLWLQASSGSGKSSLLRLLGALDAPTSGAYLVNGVDVTRLSFEELAPYRLAIGYGFEAGGLISNRTIRQNLMLPFFYHRKITAEEAEARVSACCERFGLAPVADLRPAYVSGGLRKAALVARALIHEPQLLLLDEPTLGLDESLKQVLADTIRDERASGKLRHVFVVSKDEPFMRGLGASVLDLRRFAA